MNRRCGNLLSRREFLGTLAVAPLALAQRPQRNLLLIASDDLNTCLSGYGHPLVRTPNIDRIARRGVRFERAYCQFPLCNPSRASLMTGLAPDTTKVHDNQRHFREAIPDAVTLGQLFQRHGYFSARVGKIFHYGVPGQIGTSGLDDQPTWNETVNPNGVDHTREEPLLTNYTPQRGLGSAICFYASPTPDEEHTDGLVALETIRLLEAHRKDPFFIAAGFYRPHVPWIAPTKYFDAYPLDRVELIPFEEGEMRIAPELAYFTRPAHWGLNERQRKEAMRAYYASISFLDAQVGKVLDALERLQLADRTTIVFWSDHGYHLGEHGQWMKMTLFEASARVPLIVGGAGVTAAGGVCRRTVELLDLYPTVAELCGLRGAPTGLQGRSLVPLLRHPGARWDKPAVTQVTRTHEGRRVMGYSIRTERYRYTLWDEGRLGEELYDYEHDPRELRNLASSPETAGLKSELRRQLMGVVALRGGPL
ncbi:MAG: sulfatase [Bryobacterales bacterium]|nr:sulfatase [Bryobacterales bacterium]